ncbi:related to abc1 protein precursor [Cephalotrichum gorgonifer]|uniref:Related to abc1 protein n=1 Tax=Cephalotrichum gorgonifer TaxID=2041049 RepID=A0AAE8MPY3_9PEZI|nr:related to abc1 protein precursor [Cephalotrichum gorgonifer]
MRFADFAVDLAAVIRASRSVASHHVALRARQLDALNRSSTVVNSRKQGGVGTGGAPASDQEVPVESSNTEAKRDDYGSATAEGGAEGPGRATRTTHGGTVNPPPSAESPSVLRNGGLGAFSHLQHKAGASSHVSPGGEAHSLFSPTAFPSKSHLQASTESQPAEQTTEVFEDVPPGLDINVFRTDRGSKILASLKKGKTLPPKAAVQYPAPWAGLASSANPRNEADAAVTPTREATPIPSPPEPESEPAAAAPQPVEEVALPNPLHANRPYELRESKVPATRLSRLWNYGGLAAGMLGGALTEGISRAVGGGSGSGNQGSVMLSSANMERLVSKLSRMRGAALKMGQMMSFQDAKMLPGPIHDVLQRVQDRADYMPSYQRDKVLTANLGANWRELFEEFEERPIAAASIGQVHKAKLKSNGADVAVKIQFPGVADSINSDLDNLAVLLTATKLLPKGLYLDKTIANARTELGWECDYEREAQCLTRFRTLMAGEEAAFRVPAVHAHASGRQVLTMDFMHGTAVTRVATFTQQQRDWIGTQLLRLCLREITEFHFMQTDPNWTNFLYNESTGRLELLDFGASREFPAAFVALYVRLLEAASRSDREGVKALSEKLGYLTGLESRTMLDAHVASVLTLAEPFSESAPDVYDFEGQTITERVKEFIPVMLKERLAPPPEETYSLHRKLSGAFLLCAKLGSRVRCRELFKESLERSGLLKA